MEKILAFVDLLGFSQMVNIDEDKARIILNDFYNIAFNEIKSKQSVNGHLFSDSLLAYSNSREDLINCLAAIYQNAYLRMTLTVSYQSFFYCHVVQCAIEAFSKNLHYPGRPFRKW